MDAVFIMQAFRSLLMLETVGGVVASRTSLFALASIPLSLPFYFAFLILIDLVQFEYLLENLLIEAFTLQESLSSLLVAQVTRSFGQLFLLLGMLHFI